MGSSPTSLTLPSMLLATTLQLLFMLPSYSGLQIKEEPRGHPLLARSAGGAGGGEMLSVLENSLLSVASPIELKKEDRGIVALAISCSKIEDELACICDNIHVLLDSHLVLSTAAESKSEAEFACICDSHFVPSAGAAKSIICDSLLVLSASDDQEEAIGLLDVFIWNWV